MPRHTERRSRSWRWSTECAARTLRMLGPWPITITRFTRTGRPLLASDAFGWPAATVAHHRRPECRFSRIPKLSPTRRRASLVVQGRSHDSKTGGAEEAERRTCRRSSQCARSGPQETPISCELDEVGAPERSFSKGPRPHDESPRVTIEPRLLVRKLSALLLGQGRLEHAVNPEAGIDESVDRVAERRRTMGQCRPPVPTGGIRERASIVICGS